MPLDSTNFVVETKPDLSKPSLEGLSWLLRHKEEWPTHRWDFCRVFERDDCGTAGCALGLVALQWPSYFPFKHVERLARICGVPYTEKLHEIFVPTITADTYGIHLMSKVTPAMVADRIDAYLAETRK